MEEPITLLNHRNERLFGIVHIPEDYHLKRPAIGINLLNPGVKSRVAPNRLNVKLSRMLCRKGYFVLRFDPTGIGDSEGEIGPAEPLTSVWGKIQRGLFVPDVRLANQWFKKKYGLDKLFVAGNCGGAVTALLAASGSQEVDGLVLIDLPITVDGEGKDNSTLSEVQLPDRFVRKTLLMYLYKLRSTEAWGRLLTLRSNLEEIRAAMSSILKRRISDARRPDYGIHGLNQEAVSSLSTYLNTRKQVLFVLAGNDIRNIVLTEKFFPKYFTRDHYNTGQVEILMIQDANHIYTLYPWQEELFDRIYNWISKLELNQNG